MDVKKIRIRGYLRIKPVTDRKWIPTTCGYGYFWYPHVNGVGTSIIVSVLVDTRTR